MYATTLLITRVYTIRHQAIPYDDITVTLPDAALHQITLHYIALHYITNHDNS